MLFFLDMHKFVLNILRTQHLGYNLNNFFLCNSDKFSSIAPLEGVVSLSAVGGTSVKDDLAVQGACLWVPIGWVRQVTHVPKNKESKITLLQE